MKNCADASSVRKIDYEFPYKLAEETQKLKFSLVIYPSIQKDVIPAG